MSLDQGILQLAVLLGAAVLLGLLARRIHVPVTVVLAVVGFGANVATGGAWVPHEALRGEAFEHVLILVFLPVLVFAAVLDVSVRAFFRNIGAILALAVVAMALSTVLVGVAMNAALGMALLPALVFGALISATDPVAVVAVFREVGVPRRLLTLVEGESLLNDAAAIVLASVLLGMALGQEASLGQGVLRFVTVFGGGAAIGAVLGLLVSALLPWLDRFSAIGMSLALAYGGFVVAEEVLGFSGVMATVAAGLVVHGLAPSRASKAVRESVHDFWEALDFIGNALLFLVIGLVIDAQLIAANLGPIALAVVVVLVARALAVVPVVAVLERLGFIKRVGVRNECVLVWGGLRGGVALALALALPEQLAGRESIVAITGGVVLTTLLLNATTITPLVRRLGLAQPDRFERFLNASARVAATDAARRRLDELDLDEPDVHRHLDSVEADARRELDQIDLEPGDEQQLITSRGLVIERQTYQHLSDRGLLPAPVTRKLLHEVDDQIESLQVGHRDLDARHRPQPRIDAVVQWVVGRLPSPPTEDADELAYAEASARRLAARRTGEELDSFARLPNVDQDAVERARATFDEWEEDAVSRLDDLGEGDRRAQLRSRQAAAVSSAAAADALDELVEIGLLPATVTDPAALDA